MSLLDRFLRVLAIGGLAFGLSACLRPLNGPTASGALLPDVLAAIEVEPITSPTNQERITHYLRSELVFDLDGSGQPRPKRYKLTISVAESVTAPIVDAVSGRAAAATLIANASYSLTSLDGRVITTGVASGSASYDRYIQRFANIRASRDAEIRLARLLAEQIKTRLSAVLVTSS
jgi:LPS-assembly lipoprotein